MSIDSNLSEQQKKMEEALLHRNLLPPLQGGLPSQQHLVASTQPPQTQTSNPHPFTNLRPMSHQSGPPQQLLHLNQSPHDSAQLLQPHSGQPFRPMVHQNRAPRLPQFHPMFLVPHGYTPQHMQEFFAPETQQPQPYMHASQPSNSQQSHYIVSPTYPSYQQSQYYHSPHEQRPSAPQPTYSPFQPQVPPSQQRFAAPNAPFTQPLRATTQAPASSNTISNADESNPSPPLIVQTKPDVAQLTKTQTKEDVAQPLSSTPLPSAEDGNLTNFSFTNSHQQILTPPPPDTQQNEETQKPVLSSEKENLPPSQQLESHHDENVPPTFAKENGNQYRRRNTLDSSSSHISTGSGNNERALLYAHHRPPPRVPEVHTNTGIVTNCRTLQPAEGLGAQPVLKLCTITAFVTKLRVTDRAVFIKYDDDTEAEPLKTETFQAFFNVAKPSSSLKITSENGESLSHFCNAAPNLTEWLKNVAQITLLGEFESENLIGLTKSLRNVEVFRFKAQAITGTNLNFDEWIANVPNSKFISIDSTCFDGSTLYDDTKIIAQTMAHSPLEYRSVQLFTRNCCGPLPMKYLIENFVAKIPANNTLTVITDSILYKPIFDLLVTEMNFDVGPQMEAVQCAKEIYATFSHDEDDHTFNIGFSKEYEPI